MAAAFGPRSGVSLSGGLGGPHYGRLTVLTPAPDFLQRGVWRGGAARGRWGMVAGAPRGAGAAGARSRNARMATRSLLPRRLRATQRLGVQLTRARCSGFYQKTGGLAREAVNCNALLAGSTKDVKCRL